MVHDIRADVAANILDCSVCYVIAGDISTVRRHQAGNKCPRVPHDMLVPGWVQFKKQLEFIRGIMCYNCLLPTVCTSLSGPKRCC